MLIRLRFLRIYGKWCLLQYIMIYCTGIIYFNIINHAFSYIIIFSHSLYDDENKYYQIKTFIYIIYLQRRFVLLGTPPINPPPPTNPLKPHPPPTHPPHSLNLISHSSTKTTHPTNQTQKHDIILWWTN